MFVIQYIYTATQFEDVYGLFASLPPTNRNKNG